MRRVAILLAFAAGALAAQTTLRLRYGGPSSLYHVKSVSSATPAVVTVWKHVTGAQEHDFSNGDVIYLQFVPGCKEANGYRKVVNANQAAGTFGITDLNDQPITCSNPFDASFESGVVGKVGSFTLRGTRPRIFLPGSGDLLTRSKDPDGSGPQVAPVVTENDIPWQKILSGYSAYITPGCDGVTPSLCPNEEAVLDAGDASGVQGWAAVAGAYAWFADNSKTGYLNLARYLINHMERAVVTNTSGARPGFGFPCDVTTDACGWGSGCDWSSIGMFNFALAYDLIRDQLSPEERQTFARKMLNGWGGEHDCANQLQKQTGTANLTNGSKTVTGSGFSVYSPGDGVYFKTGGWGTTGRWGFVVSVASDSEMTVNFIIGTSKTAASNITYTGADHYKVLPWDDTKCGAAFFAGGQGNSYNVAGAVIGRAVTTLASSITADQTTITVTNAGSFPETAPFYVICESEVMLVTARNGNQFTVVRGQMYSTAAPHGAGRGVVWTSQLHGNIGAVSGPRALTGEWYHNLTAQKAVGYLLAAFALAGDDSRAAAYAEAIWNWYYDLIYLTNKEYWSGPTQGGLQNSGYHWGRWQGTHWRVGLVGRNAFIEGPIDVMDDYFWRGLVTAFLWTPPTRWNAMPIDPSAGDTYSNVSLGWTAMAATLWPGREAAYAAFWYRNLSGLLSALTGKTAAPVAAYGPPWATQTDFRDELPPWSFHTESDFNPDAYYGLLVSKRDWTSSAGMLVAAVGWNWPTDHVVDQGAYLPGGYSIFKGGKLLFGWDNSYGTGGSSGSNWFYLASGASSLKPITNPPWFSGSLGSQKNQIDRRHGDQNYVYARGNFTQSWGADAKVVRNHRHFLHIKTDPEYVIVYDDAEMSEAKTARTNLQYFLRFDSGQTFQASQDYRSIVFKKPTGVSAMISSRVFFPGVAAPAVTYAQTSNVHRVTFDWGAVTSARMLVVHRIASGTEDQMPAVELLGGLDSESVGVEILDARDPVAVVFARNGADRSECSFRAGFAQTGRIIVTGLAPGSYRVFRDSQEISGSPFVVSAGDGTLYVAGPGGAYVISAVPPASLSVDPTALAFEYRVGEEPPRAQTFRATCTGGTCAVAVEENCSWLSVSPQNGITPADFAVSADPQGLGTGHHTCTIRVSAPALNSPQQVSVTLDITSQPEEPAVAPVVIELVGATTRKLLVRYGKPGLKRAESCTVQLTDSASWDRFLETVEDSGGPARRVVVFGDGVTLQPGTEYYARALCGAPSEPVRVMTRATSLPGVRTVSFRMRPAGRMAVNRVRLEYGPTAALGQSVEVACAGGSCNADLQAQPDQLLYFRYTYLDSSGNELARSSLMVAAVP